MKNLRVLVFAVFLSALGLLSGCGKKTGKVSGEVAAGEVKIPWGTITFYNEDKQSQSFSSNIDDGKFAIESKMPVGNYKVVVIAFDRPGSEPDPRSGAPKNLDGFQNQAGGPQTAKKSIKIPSKYQSLDTTDLTYEVTSGGQTKEFTLDALK